jgi:hypothetical protein
MRFQSVAFSRIMRSKLYRRKIKKEENSEVQNHRHNVTKIQQYYEINFDILTVANDSIIADV